MEWGNSCEYFFTVMTSQFCNIVVRLFNQGKYLLLLRRLSQHLQHRARMFPRQPDLVFFDTCDWAELIDFGVEKLIHFFALGKAIYH
jgi:hypothetical protein